MPSYPAPMTDSYGCTCLELRPPDPADSGLWADGPCLTCCAWTADFDAPDADQPYRAYERRRCYEVACAVAPREMVSLDVARFYYDRWAARCVAAGQPVPLYQEGLLYGIVADRWFTALCRHRIQRAGFSWRAE